MKRILTTTFIFLSAMAIMAEGYQVNMQSQKQTGMGHTGAGQRLGATSIHFNPGAMAFMPGKFDFSLGASGVLSKNKFEGAQGISESDNPMGTPLFFYGAMQLSDRLAAGIGVTSPYGNSLKWGDDWQGKYLIQDISLQAIFVTPTLAYKLTDKLSVGAGLVIGFGSVDLNRGLSFAAINPDLPDGQVNLKGSTTSYGFTGGLFYQISDKVSAGVSYRSKVLMKMEDGDAEFSVHSAVAAYFPEGNKFNSELPMPSNLTFGLGWQASDKWYLAFDLQAVGWSAYESLDFDFENNTPALQDSKNARNFDNTLIYRLGASYTPSASVVFRAGLYYDSTPIPEDYLTPETPGTNKVGASIGLSWLINDKLSVDASLLHIMGQEREDGYRNYPSADNPIGFYGTYNTSAWLPGIGISYTF